MAGFRRSRRLPLRGIFNFQRKIFRKSKQRIVGEWKQSVNFIEKGCFLAILAAYLLRGYFFAGQIWRFQFGIEVSRSRVSNWDTDVWGNHWAVWPQIWILPPQIHNRYPRGRSMRTVIATRIITRRVGRHSGEWECLQHRSVVQA